jgi:hypothetical protein
MSSLETPDTAGRRADLVRSAWERIREHLGRQKQQVYEEIKQYPRPIPACDQQFNYLLEERARLSRELSRVVEALQESLTRGDALALIDQFLASSGSFTEDAKQAIRSSWREGLSGPEV